MTDHPLTDDFCHRIAESWPPDAAEKDNMRSAADWQLERAIAWLKLNTDDYLLQDYYTTYFLTEAFLDDFKKAMRPTKTQENNNG